MILTGDARRLRHPLARLRGASTVLYCTVLSRVQEDRGAGGEGGLFGVDVDDVLISCVLVESSALIGSFTLEIAKNAEKRRMPISMNNACVFERSSSLLIRPPMDQRKPTGPGFDHLKEIRARSGRLDRRLEAFPKRARVRTGP